MYIYIKSENKVITFFMSLFPERETNVESVSERGTVDISRNSPNPFHVSFHATVKQFHVSCPNSTQNSRYFLAKSTLIPRKIHGKKSRDMRDSTFVSVRDINITLTVLYFTLLKMPTIVGILTFISRINYRLWSSSPSISTYLGYFGIYEQFKF